MKEIEAFKREGREALKKFPFLRRMEILDEHREAIRLRLYIREDLFIQGYFNRFYQLKPAIESGRTGLSGFLSLKSREFTGFSELRVSPII